MPNRDVPEIERLEPYEHPELGAQMRPCQTLGGYVTVPAHQQVLAALEDRLAEAYRQRERRAEKALDRLAAKDQEIEELASANTCLTERLLARDKAAENIERQEELEKLVEGLEAKGKGKFCDCDPLRARAIEQEWESERRLRFEAEKNAAAKDEQIAEVEGEREELRELAIVNGGESAKHAERADKAEAKLAETRAELLEKRHQDATLRILLPLSRNRAVVVHAGEDLDGEKVGYLATRAEAADNSWIELGLSLDMEKLVALAITPSSDQGGGAGRGGGRTPGPFD
jgi:hypothetical protein